MRLLVGLLIAVLAVLVGCSKEPPQAAGTDEPPQQGQEIYEQDFEGGEAAVEPAGTADEASEEEASGEPPQESEAE